MALPFAESSPSDPFETLASTWESLAQDDPLWAILSAPDKRGRKWNLDEFFRTGSAEIEELMHRLEHHGIAFERDAALDFGCGVGRLTQALALHFRSVYGVDVAPTMIRTAEAHNKHRAICRYLLNREDNLSAFHSAQFSFMLSSIVLQHLPVDLARKYIAEFVRILRPGGLLIFQIPARFIQEKVLSAPAFLAKITCLEKSLSLTPKAQLFLDVLVENASTVPWHFNDPFPLTLGNHWLREDDSLVLLDDGRTRLPEGLAPGEVASLKLQITAPDNPGSYKLELDLVQEGVTWFKDNGSPTHRLDVVVEEKQGSHLSASVAERDKRIDEPAGEAALHFDMNCIPRAEIIDLLDQLGCKLEFIESSGAGGIGTLSYYYYARKR
jgi:2-polyprenyl-3-methyl-5-hydroxy-6-metoxy-1,4-benzoquinol methylase